MREVIIRRFEEGWGIEMVGVADDGRVYTLVRRACEGLDEEDRLWDVIVRSVGMIEQGLRSGKE